MLYIYVQCSLKYILTVFVKVLNDLTFLHRQVWLRAIPAGEDDNNYKTHILCEFILVFILFLSQFKQNIKIKYDNFNHNFTILVRIYAN